MILVFPPVAKPSEPPAGIAKLVGALNHHGIPSRVLDANIEGLLFLMDNSRRLSDAPSGRWTTRALRSLSTNLAALRDRNTYRNIDRYARAVMDLNRVLEISTEGKNVTIGLANYGDERLSPLRSSDLIRAAENPEVNPFYPYFEGRLLKLLEEEQPSAVGFSLNYLSQALCTFAMAGFLRRHCPGLTLVLGGGLVTSWVKNQDWQEPYRTDPFVGLIDHLVAGPGEDRLLSIMKSLHARRPAQPRSGRKLMHEISSARCEIVSERRTGHNTRPDATKGLTSGGSRPDYNSLPLHDYLAPGFVLPYSGASGCSWKRCSFCPERAEDNPYFPLPAARVAADLTSLAEESRPVLLHLLDNAVSTAVMKSLSLNPPGIPWYGFARIGPQLAEMDFCLDLKRSGCVMLKLGLESGDQGVLDSMEKGIDLVTASRVLKTLKKAGIASYVYLLFGTPPEAEAEAGETLDFTVRHSNEIGFLNLALFNMPLRGPYASRFETSRFYEGDLSLYADFSHPKGWNRRRVRRFLEREFKKHPAVAPILIKDPPLFTSNHAPFFTGGYG